MKRILFTAVITTAIGITIATNLQKMCEKLTLLNFTAADS